MHESTISIARGCSYEYVHVSLDGDACEWYFSLPPSSISSLKNFHIVFYKHCKRYFSAEFLFENCCEEYELHNDTEDIDKEKIVPHNLQQFSNDI